MKNPVARLLVKEKVTLWRQVIQWGFVFWCVFLGVQFGLFVRYYQSGGQTLYYARPPGVEAFLPIGALVSLKSWLLNGAFDRVHPAALVLFLTFVLLALLTKKSFCSWICPVGALEEGLWKGGRKLMGRNFRIWRWLDLGLQFAKYALLLFFVKLILLDMPAQALQGFLNAPYWAVADIRMLHFFTNMSTTSLTVILVLALLSVVYQNFWCRYLCPYGALLGLISFLSPLKVRRRAADCISCGACSRSCPQRIDVQRKESVRSVECNACLTCVGKCPEPGALSVRPPIGRWALPSWGFGVLVLALFSAGVATGMLSGHWETSLTHLDYLRLVPLAERLGF